MNTIPQDDAPKQYLIPLTQNQHAIVSVEDGDLAEKKWYYRRGYAIRTKPSPARGHLYMHRVVLGRVLNREILPGEEVDHIDGNGLNNQRDNLRLATRLQNAKNMSKPRDNTSGFKGVSFDARYNVWVAHISHDGKQHHLGHYETPEQAAKAYDDAAREMHGKFARLNNIPDNVVARPVERLRKSNTSGHVGVSFSRRKQKWVAYIRRDGRRHFLGQYDTREAAISAYTSAASSQEIPSVKGKLRASNTSGYRGVSFHKSHGKWGASIRYEQKQIHLGYFSTPQDAALAYNQAVIRFHYDPALLNVI